MEIGPVSPRFSVPLLGFLGPSGQFWVLSDGLTGPHVTWQDWAVGGGPEKSWQAPFRHILNTAHLSRLPLCLLEQTFPIAQTHLCFY